MLDHLCVCVCARARVCVCVRVCVRVRVCVQVTLGVFLVAAPSEVWITWCGLGLGWLVTFFFHEVVHLICKIRHRVKKDNTNY